MRLRAYSAITHQGPFLEINEDGYDFDLNQNFFCVLDGFGGLGAGDKAVAKLKEQLKDFVIKLADDPNSTMPLYWNPRYLIEGNALINAMLNAHQRLLKENNELGLNRRAGASGVMALKAGQILVVAMVGNCNAFLFRQGKVEKLFTADSFRFLQADDQVQNASAAPMSAFGLFPELTYQVREIRLGEGDHVLLSTDGLHGMLGEEELAYVLARGGSDLQAKLNALLKLSNTHGNKDNQTGVILEF